MLKRKSKKNGYTLLELLIITGVVSLATAAVYASAKIASDWAKSSRETEKLQVLFRQIDDSTSMVGTYTGIEMSNLVNISSGIDSVLGLDDVRSPTPRKLHFEYKNVSARICRDLTGKMLSSSGAVNVIVNDTFFYKTEELGNLVAACDNDDNDVTIVLNKYEDNTTTASVTPSINVSPSAPALPVDKAYVSPPTMQAPYVTSTVTPIRYSLTDFPPSTTPIVPSTPPGVYQPPMVQPSTPSTPPFTPPNVVIPPATPNNGNSGSQSGDSWACPIGTCSVVLFVENDGANTYFGLTMFPVTPSIAAKNWQKGDMGDSVSDKEVIVSPVIPASSAITVNGGWTHAFNYTNLRTKINQYGVSDGAIPNLGLDAFMGSEIVASNGARFQIGSLERYVPSATIYGSPYSGRVNFYFMKKL